ncbi:MAG: beta-ketoacyl-ACP synthase III [Abyssibacter sp.]|uniref:beta-ketoacyl-ACP synthase III n=1 Tax=Abyssibacter sp. TaxID=2320200 RepID=UPI003219FA7F
MQDVFIRGTSAVLPNAPVSNDDMESVLGQIGDRPARERRIVLSRNGIRQRYYAMDPATRQPTHTNARLTAESVRGLVGADFSLPDLDVLACGTSSPDQMAPGHGVMVHGELPEAASCEAVSLAGICCSGVAALRYAALTVAAGQARTAVATGSETASTFMRSEQFTAQYEAQLTAMERRPELAFDGVFLRWMLSDGAGALLLGQQPAEHGLSFRLDWIELRSYAHEQAACMYAGARKRDQGSLQGWRALPADAWSASGAMTFQQDVRQLNEHIVALTIERALPEVLARRPLAADAIDWFLPHYSSEYFRPRIQQGLRRIGFEIPEERWFTNLPEVGNVGSASIYLMLDALQRESSLAPGQRVLCFVPESGRFSAAYMLLTVVEAA